MRANPGGYIPPADVVGRDELIARIWHALERQSLVLSAERRMGKTSIIKKMVAEHPAGVLPVYRDLEQVHTPAEFAELVFHDVEDYLSRAQKVATKARQFFSGLTGAEVGKIVKFPQIHTQHWKTMLNHTIDDLVEHKDCRIAFFWDELPLMIYNIKKSSGEAAAMEVLDTLRALRQTHESLRMVFTGSIGLHNVVADLKRAGYANNPTNDMHKVDVPPLDPLSTAANLARNLLEGESIAAENPAALARAIAEAVDGFPFYIQHVIVRLACERGPATEEAVAGIVERFLVDDQDAWELRHFRDRINTYYSVSERPFALNLLDILSTRDTPLPFEDLFNLLKSRIATEDVEVVRQVLQQLQLDHYVTRNTVGCYQFRFPIIARWWRLDRGV